MGLSSSSQLRGLRTEQITQLLCVLLCGASFVWAIATTSDWFNGAGLPLLGQFLQASLHPVLASDFLAIVGRATLTTFAYAVWGTVLSVSLGLIGGILSSEIWWQTINLSSANRSNPHRSARCLTTPPRRGFSLWNLLLGGVPVGGGLIAPHLIRMGLAIPRAIHELIWGLLLVRLWGLDSLTAVVAIALPFGAIVSKVFADILDETPREPLKALLSSGARPLSAFCYALLPLALPNLVSYSFYRFECALRSAAVLGVIGAGGLGTEIYVSLQSLRYNELWTLLYALLLLNGIVDGLSALWRQRLGFTSRLSLNLPKRWQSLTTQRQAAVTLHRCLSLSVIILFGFALWSTPLSWDKFWSPVVGDRLGEMVVHFTQWPTAQIPWSRLLGLMGQTLAMSIVAMTLAAVTAIAASLWSAHTLHRPGGLLQPTVRLFSVAGLGRWGQIVSLRVSFLLCRAIPTPIWALLVLFILFPGIWPGAIALAIHNFGILGRLMTEAIENLDEGPVVAIANQGSRPTSTLLYGVLPLTLTQFLAYSFYRWEVCLRETVLVGFVGAGGIGRLLTEQLSSFDDAGMGVSLVCLIGLTLGVDMLSQRVRRSLRQS